MGAFFGGGVWKILLNLLNFAKFLEKIAKCLPREARQAKIAKKMAILIVFCDFEKFCRQKCFFKFLEIEQITSIKTQLRIIYNLYEKRKKHSF